MSYISSLILAGIFLVPIASLIKIPGTIVWYPQFLAFLAIGFLLLSSLYWKMNKFISLFSIYLLFSYLFVCQQHPRALLCLVCGHLGLIVSYYVSRETSTSRIYLALCILGGLTFVYVILQSLGIDPFFCLDSDHSKKDVVGFLGSHNQLGIYSAALGIISLVYGWFYILLAFVPLIFVKTTSTVIGLLSGVIAYLYITKNKLRHLLLLLVVSLGIIFTFGYDKSVNSFKERFLVWGLTVQQSITGRMDLFQAVNVNKRVTANPLTGFGIGSFTVTSPYSQFKVLGNIPHRYEHAHNDLIEALFEYGYIGFILILLVIGSVFYHFNLVINKTKELIIVFCSLIAVSVSSFGVYVFHAPASYFLFMLLVGLFYAEVRNANTRKIS